MPILHHLIIQCFVVHGPENPFCFSSIPPEDIAAIILHLPNSNGCDYLGLSSRMIKHAYLAIVYPLTHLINQSITMCRFPSVLKVAEVIPLPKKACTCEIDGFRPISKLPLFSKIFEKGLNHQLGTFLEKNNLFSDCQFGFRKSRSTQDAMLRFSDFISDCFLNGTYASAVCVDVAKCFDCVPHRLLLSKSTKYNFSDDAIRLLGSFLADRFQAVRLKNTVSDACSLGELSVVQGSVLGPTLFLIFVNYLPQHMSNVSVLFADDSSVLCQDNSIESLVANSEKSVNEITSWFNANRLSVNTDKTQTMYFGLRDLSSLGTNPRDLKMLGIRVDPELNWKAHCEQLTASLSSVTFLLRRLRDCLSGDAVLRAYHAVFHSRMSYCLLCWGHSPSAALVFGCQRRAVRAVLRRGYRSDVKADFAKIGVLILLGHILDCLVYIHANLDSSPQVSHAYGTRNAGSLVVPNCRLNVARNALNWWGPKFFNVIPHKIQRKSRLPFKVACKSFLLKLAPYNFEEFISSAQSWPT